MQLLILSLIFAPMVMGILIYAIDRIGFSRGVFLLQLGLTLGVGLLIVNHSAVLFSGNGAETVAGGWSPQVGVGLLIDRVSLLFVLMTVLAFWYIYLYVWWSRKGDHKFLFFLSMLQGAMMALFMVNDLFSMFILIELITIICSILITYKKDGLSVKAGLYYLLYNSIAMILFLLGIVFVYTITGSLNLNLIGSTLSENFSSPVYRWAMALIFSGFCLKSAVFPVFSWLPLAHASAPASVSALLSGLVVKSGLFILLRLGALVFVPGVRETLLMLGILSGLFGAFMAFLQTDIKRILAYSTISQVGLIVIGLSTPGAASEWGAILHIFNHFLFKSLLFLCAGTLITVTGQRHIRKIRGVLKADPLLGFTMVVGILGITGAPLFNGSLSKAIITGAQQGHPTAPLVTLIGIGTVLYIVRFSTMLTGVNAGGAYRTDARISAQVYLAVLVLLAFPLELMALRRVSDVRFVLDLPILLMDLLKYGLVVAGAICVYRFVYLPNEVWLQRFDNIRYSFHRGVGILILMLAALSVLFV